MISITPKQVNRVIQEILTKGIPQEPERIAAMLVVLRQVANLRNERMRFAVCQLQQDLIQIARIYQDYQDSLEVARRKDGGDEETRGQGDEETRRDSAPYT